MRISARTLLLLAALFGPLLTLGLGLLLLRDGVLPSQRLVLAAGGSLAACTLLAFWVAHRLDARLRSLRTWISAHAAAAPPSAPPTRLREIGELGAAATRLAVQLRERAAHAERERDELSRLLNAVGEGIVQLDGAGRMLRFNPAAARLLALPAAARGSSYAATIRSPAVRELLQRVLAGERLEPVEVASDEHRLLLVAEPHHGAGGRASGAVVVFIDLTQLRRLESVRRDFVANVSHEMKTPLTSIRGYAETLLTDAVSPDIQRRFLETIAENARRLQRIVDDLLDLSAIESGGWSPTAEPVDLHELALASWNEHRQQADRRGIRFTPPAANFSAIGDPVALRQIFANLFDNALRYTPDGGRIRVTLREAHAAEPPCALPDRAAASPPSTTEFTQGTAPLAPWIIVDVQDNGSGIPREALPRIFERFYRVDAARSRAAGGTGLGLAIVKHLAEAMGGCVRAESAVGRGTTIRFALPAAAPRARPVASLGHNAVLAR
ncbi:MAG: sensor histidine kinase [Longimicrobiales bacterium]